MSETLANATFNVGRDVAVVLIPAEGPRIDLTGNIEVTWKAIAEAVTHEPLNAPPRRRYLPGGHEFTLTLERRGPANEELFNQIEAQYWAGGYPNGTQDGGIIYVYTTEADGSTTKEMGTNVSLFMPDRTTATQKSAIKQTIEGFASTKVTM